MKIAFYYNLIIRGGVEAALRNLLQKLSVNADVYVVYSDARSDKDFLDELSNYATVTNDLSFADIVVECSIFQRSNIMCGYRIQWIHGCAIECHITTRYPADKYIAVSKEAARQYGGADVYKNELDSNIVSMANEKIKWDFDGLKLVTISRIAHMKGFDRMPALCRELERQKIPYQWLIVGRAFVSAYGDQVKQELKDYNVTFVGEKKNPYPYMKAADYVVQLSDAESFGLSTMEGQVLGTPSIITDYSASEILKGHAYMLDMDMSNVSDIVSRLNTKPTTMDYKGDIDKWNRLLNKEVTHGMIVKSTKRFKDIEASDIAGRDIIRKPNDKWECSDKRGKHLKQIGFVEIIEQATQKRLQEGTVEKRKAVRSK